LQVDRVGRWRDDQTEIDVVGVNEEANAILFAEVKWSARPIGTDIYQALKQNASRVLWGRPTRREIFALFSRREFTPDMWRLEHREGILLFLSQQDHVLQ
jgi:AAA+ ATPase superfamily predicted ATPase